MATTQASYSGNAYTSDSEDGQASGGRKPGVVSTLPNLPPTSGSLAQPPGQLLKGAIDKDGKHTDPAILIGIKLDLEAEIHLTARVRGDITIGLY
ncbi:hypothetical protein K402DRAFT_72481 [Aulographum hederae CBS 113979]|uniref:Uncharacterized protein n=1 Tax=Aulographum hederae CBS 113979 TaxID=1176131 RepID=A0A6G1HFL4_9PEZI|nr:hypothetical protein K402DRAFT_72481 [Aulographum hederae CBS 113979]